jgi:hypothetical protein
MKSATECNLQQIVGSAGDRYYCYWRLFYFYEQDIFLVDRMVYIHGSAGGDKMTGRVLCGGELHRTTFASLPPHFRKDLVLTDRELRAIFPAFDRMKTACPSFISCLPYLLASGAQHWDYVKSILKGYPQHVVFHTTFSRDNYASKYRSLVLLGDFECSESNLKVTGKPPTLSILREIKELRKEVASLMTGRSESSATLMMYSYSYQ